MKINILQFFSTLNNGGAENRMMDVYRCINSDIVKFDFAVLHDGVHFFDKEVYDKGSKKNLLPDPRAGFLKNYRALVRFFKENQHFQAVHTHVSWYGGVVLLAAKRSGIKIRIAHARDAGVPNISLKEKIIRNIGKVLIGVSATQKIAISEEAAKNVFGKRTVRKNNYLFVPNSIDQKKYRVLDEARRKELRKKLGIDDNTKAYVTVANLRKQKNHMFLIDIAHSLKDKGDNFHLFLIGEGVLREEIEKKILDLDLKEYVTLLGTRDDVPDILCAFDAMIFPSFFEGLGGVVLETQLVGVPAIVSDGIPKAVDVGINMVDYVSLDESPIYWADTIINKTNSYTWNHDDALEAFRKKGYIIEQTARKYLEEYGIDTKTIDLALKNKEEE